MIVKLIQNLETKVATVDTEESHFREINEWYHNCLPRNQSLVPKQLETTAVMD